MPIHFRCLCKDIIAGFLFFSLLPPYCCLFEGEFSPQTFILRSHWFFFISLFSYLILHIFVFISPLSHSYFFWTHQNSFCSLAFPTLLSEVIVQLTCFCFYINTEKPLCLFTEIFYIPSCVVSREWKPPYSFSPDIYGELLGILLGSTNSSAVSLTRKITCDKERGHQCIYSYSYS